MRVGSPMQTCQVLIGELAGDQDGLAAVVIAEDLEQTAALVVVERDHFEVVKHDEIGLGVVAQEFRVTAVGLGDREILEEPGRRR